MRGRADGVVVIDFGLSLDQLLTLRIRAMRHFRRTHILVIPLGVVGGRLLMKGFTLELVTRSTSK